MTDGLTHIDQAGRARMVDVTGKPWTRRRALARAQVDIGRDAVTALARVRAADRPDEPTWTDVLGAARLAGIQAAKRTPEMIPLCHPLTVSNVDVRLSLGADCVQIEGEAEVIGPTGVEMEALAACTVAALSVVAAVLPIAPQAAIGEVGLWAKSGGRSGTWTREAVHPHAD